MRALANGFLLVFALDAVLSVLDSVVLTPGSLRDLPQVVAGISLGGSILVFFALALVPALPKRILLPLVLYGPFALMAGMPLPLYVGLDGIDAALAFVQLALAAAALWGVFAGNGRRSLLLLADQVGRPGPSVGYTVRFALAAAVLVPVLGIVYAGVCLKLTLDVVTAGFIELRSDGVYAQERDYALEGHIVRLVGMVHIGDGRFYDEVIASIPEVDAIVLVEGVTDKGALLENELSYEGVADALGLDVQSAIEAPGRALDIEHADVDVSAFSPSTLETLNAIAAALGSEGSSEERMDAWREFTRVGSSLEMLQSAVHDVLDLRNAHLLERVEEVLADHALVVVPWGAAHMPGLEFGLLARGAEHVGTVQRRLVAF